MPELQKLYRRLEGQGLALITIHTQRRSEQMQEWMRTNGIDLPACVDADDATIAQYHVDSFPDYYVIDRSGTLRVADLANADLERTLGKLLAEPAPMDTQPHAQADAASVFAKARAEAKRDGKRIFAFPTADW